jgi:hypothetical protein
MRTETLNDVPDSEVEQVVQDYKDEGATVTKTRNPDGTWTVTATFPAASATPA